MNKGNINDKKRLLIFLGLTFGLSWMWFFISNPKTIRWGDLPMNRQNFVCLGMLFPLIAHILTRRITKEGFALSGSGSMRLGITFSDRKWIFFIFALLLPWAYTELSNLIAIIICPDLYDKDHALMTGVDKRLIPLLPVNAIVTGAIGSFAALGEEAGWRGYMMPKLMKLTGRYRALLIGGVIWGLWHAPLTCIGHNFGTDYPGFPFTGILIMCVYCVFVGVILTFVTERSGSVWPAAILHAVNNSCPSILAVYMDPAKSTPTRVLIAQWGGMLIGTGALALAVIMVWRKTDKEAVKS